MKKHNVGRYLIFAIILIVASILFPELGIFTDADDSTPITGDLDIYFLDVDQGDSAFIHTPEGNTILIDGGEAKSADTILKFLDEKGIDRLDIVIATHAHADHIGGLVKVVEQMDIGAVYMPKATHTTKTFENLVMAVQAKGLKFKAAYAGAKIPLEDVNAQFVGPIEKDSYEDLNNSSAVLRLVYGEMGFLFTGDAETEAEMEMISSGQNLRAQVLKLGHHGSTTSSTEEFLDAVSPEYGIISCGKDNKYGHPHVEILERLKDNNISIYRTDELGTIHIRCDGKKVEFK